VTSEENVSWDELRAEWAARDPEFEKEVERGAELMELDTELYKLRQRRGTTQAALAEYLGMTQANVSRIEHAKDVRLSTLRRYVEGLGGRLEVRAVFPDGPPHDPEHWDWS
jgi:DNA-binding Xre family transcriptional regulator